MIFFYNVENCQVLFERILQTWCSMAVPSNAICCLGLNAH